MEETFAKAQRLLKRRDPVLKGLIQQVGPCSLRVDTNHFQVLVRSIVSQQISTKAALSISARLLDTLKNRLTPDQILTTSEADLRSAGLSVSKVKSLLDLADKCASGAIRFDTFGAKSDDEVKRELLPVRGIGPWTADMFLIFSLGRMDVLPVGDFGLKAGVRNQYGLADLPTPTQLHEIAEPWKPYRAIATWYIWRSFGPVPQS